VYGKPFDKVSETQREDILQALSSGKLVFENGPPARTFFGVVYQTVMEGMFADPIYGGNRDMAAWKMLGFPGWSRTTGKTLSCTRTSASLASLLALPTGAEGRRHG